MSDQRPSMNETSVVESTPASRRKFLATAGRAAAVPPAMSLLVSAGSKPANAAKRYSTQDAKEARREARRAKRDARREARQARREARRAEDDADD